MSQVRASSLLFLSISFLPFLQGCAGERFLQTSDGVRIAYEEKKASAPKGTVLLLHGLGSDMDEWYNFKRSLHRAGWSYAAVDLRGHGLSTTWNDEPLNWRDLTPEGALTTAQDVQAAVKSLPDGPLWIIGSSFGANLALYYAAMNPEITGVVLLTPGLNYRGIESEPALLKYGKRPLFIAASSGEPGAERVARYLHERAQEPKRLDVSSKEGHGSEMMEFNSELEKEILEWMEAQTAHTAQNPISG